MKNFGKYSGKHLQSSPIFIGNGKPRPVTLQSIGLHHRFFSSNFFQDFSEKLFCRALVNNIYGIDFFSTSCVVSSSKYIVNHPHVEFVIDLLNLLLSLAHEFSCEFWEIFQKTFLYRTPLVAAPEVWRRDFQKPKFWNHVHFWMEKKLKENYKFHGCDWKWLKRGILLGVLLHLEKKFLMR